MVSSPSSTEHSRQEDDRAVTIPQPAASNSIGLHIPIKLTRENFLLWRTQLFPLLNCHDLAHILTQEQPIAMQSNAQGEITVNPAYQAWW